MQSDEINKNFDRDFSSSLCKINLNPRSVTENYFKIQKLPRFTLAP